MKKVFYICLIGFILFSFFSFIQEPNEGIDRAKLTADCKTKMEPYKYDSQKFTKINFSENTQLLEIEVPVFIGEKYRIVFNTNALLPNKININVYTKSKKSSNRQPIYTTNGDNSNTGEFVFDVPRVRKLFIDYEVPPNTSASKEFGYILMMVGYK